MTAENQPVDGNALAGPLGEIFAVDITAAVGRCAHCGHTGAVAAVRVYTRARGLVGRCASCDGVVIKLVRTPTEAFLDLSGTAVLRIPLAEERPAGE